MITDFILKSLDKNHIAQLLLFALSLAFNTIDHNIICIQLVDIDISHNYLKYIKSYLDNRVIRY